MTEYIKKLSFLTLFLMGAVLVHSEINQNASDGSTNSENQFNLPIKSFEIINEVAGLVLDANILGYKLNNNLLGLKCSDYLSVNFGVLQDEKSKTAISNAFQKHIQNIFENNPDYPKTILKNSSVEIIKKRYEKILKKLSVDTKINVDDYENIQHALLYSLFWDVKVKKMLEYEAFKNYVINHDTVIKKLALELRSNVQEAFSTENCQIMLKKFGTDEWRTYINIYRNIQSIIQTSSQGLAETILKNVLKSGEFKMPVIISKEDKSIISKAMGLSQDEIEKANIFPNELLNKVEEKLIVKFGLTKSKEIINGLKREKSNFLYISIKMSFTNETLNTMINLNNNPLSIIVKDKNDFLSEKTFNIISKLVKDMK